MRIAVMGAGAVGCYYGARLFQAGHEVVLIGRPALVEAVRAHGLRLSMDSADALLPMRADTDPAAVAGAELVLFCVKSADTESAGAAIKPHLAPNASVVSLQNGVDNAERLSRVLGREAIPAAVYVAVGIEDAGHVVHHGRGELQIGPSPSSAALAQALSAANVPTTVSARVAEALWLKLTINCAWNALSALTQSTYGELARDAGIVASMHEVVKECAAVAQALAIELPDRLWDEVLAISRSMAGQRSSTAQDLARGRPSEIDHINGRIVREGERLGVPVPVNRVLHALVKARDRKAGDARSGCALRH
ncbi:MAG: 2-dehydropantoate 2-reductase [Pseudoxanthomonas sp.]